MNTKGVIHSPSGSLTRQIAWDAWTLNERGEIVPKINGEPGYHLDDSGFGHLLTPWGKDLQRGISQDNYNAGATVGVTPTIRVTGLRGIEGGEFTNEHHQINQTAAEILRTIFHDRQVLGAVLSSLDTGGADDSDYLSLPDHLRVDHFTKRHRPQINSQLAGARLNGIIVEAGRYLSEMIAIARLARDYGAEKIVVSYEANKNGIPDPLASGLSFADFKRDLQSELGNQIEVIVGINCIGLTLAQNLLSRFHGQIDLVYPNGTDAFLLEEADRAEFFNLLSQKHLSPEQQVRLTFLASKSTLDDGQWKNAFQGFLDNGASVIGSCCGGTIRHVEIASQVISGSSNALHGVSFQTGLQSPTGICVH